jgi:two-component system chemotaxis response regulator CheY
MATILVVDDSGYARRLLRTMLEANGHTVGEAKSGLEALESYFVQRPDVVLLDLTMEDMSGFDVLARLREGDPSARVIVISADVQRSTEKLVIDAGGFRFLGKPANREEVLASIAAALGEVAP